MSLSHFSSLCFPCNATSVNPALLLTGYWLSDPAGMPLLQLNVLDVS